MGSNPTPSAIPSSPARVAERYGDAQLDAVTGDPDDQRQHRLARALRANLHRRKAARDAPGPDEAAPPNPAATRREALDGASGAERLSSDIPAEPSSADPSAERSS
ncbi:MAG: hypothetical protein INR64_06140 [Caulobacteraceae bacterium]|nr:hypothetical protein [Caulobacter sp.]